MKVFLSLLVALVLLFIGLGGIIYLPKFVQQEINALRKITSPASPLFDTWVAPVNATDHFLNVYLLNIKNVASLITPDVVPELETMGPYVYEIVTLKKLDSIAWFVNGTVSYTYTKTYTFRQDLSGKRKETDEITNFNFPAHAIIITLQYLPKDEAAVKWASIKASFTAHEVSMFVKHTVKEWIWGFEDVDYTKEFKISPYILLANNTDTSKHASAQYSGEFGHPKGMTAQDAFGHFASWCGQTSLGVWGSSQANMINGTDGFIFKSNIGVNDTLSIFEDGLLRSFDLTFANNSVYEDIPLKCFQIEPKMWLTASQNQSNEAYHVIETGFLPIPYNELNTSPKLTVSKPYFLDASLKNIKLILDGQKVSKSANKEAHDTQICVESTTGLTMKSNQRYQVNFMMHPLKVYDEVDHKIVESILPISKDLTTTWMPLLWYDISSTIGIAESKAFKSRVYSPLFIGRFGGIACIVLAIVFIIIALLLVFSNMKEKRRNTMEKEILVHAH